MFRYMRVLGDFNACARGFAFQLLSERPSVLLYMGPQKPLMRGLNNTMLRWTPIARVTAAQPTDGIAVVDFLFVCFIIFPLFRVFR